MIENEKPKLNEEKQAQRAKIVLKNIDVGVDGAVKKSEKKNYSKDKRKVEPNPMEYTFYVRKSGMRFYEPKSNLIN